jgi:aminoglycoside phosphotransferase (APT) family kinase protein
MSSPGRLDDLDDASLAALHAVLRRTFPVIGSDPITGLDQGFGATVLLTRRHVFRVARTAEAAAGHRREWGLLPRLQDRLPARIPLPRWTVEEAPGLPFGAIGYERLEGTPLIPPRTADADVLGDIARFLASLHAQPVEFAAGHRSAEERREERNRLAEAELPLLERHLSGPEFHRLQRWWREVAADRQLDAFDPVLIHGDAWYGNMLVDDRGRLSAVLDWEAARADDPATDLARQSHLGRDAGQRVLSLYRNERRTDVGFEHRVRRRWELVELGGLSWCLRMDDELELRDCLHKWRTGPVLSSWW